MLQSTTACAWWPVYDLFSTVLTGEKIGVNKKISVEDKRIKLVNYAAALHVERKKLKALLDIAQTVCLQKKT